MKKILLLTLVSIWSLSAFSQDYHPLFKGNKNWNILSAQYSFDPGPPSVFGTEKLSFREGENDTIINSETYYDILGRDVYVREDTIEKKVWFLILGTERVLYDFSLDIGDTTELLGLVVDTITEEVINQTTRKKYWLSNGEIWIEGIGSTLGILRRNMIGYVGATFWLLCAYEDEQLVYQNPDYNTCYIQTSVKEVEDEAISIYPNPAKEQLFIEGNLNLIKEVSIYDIAGHEVKTLPLKARAIDISGLEKGVYFIRFNEQRNFKFIKL